MLRQKFQMVRHTNKWCTLTPNGNLDGALTPRDRDCR
jgi:hypothetical protein